jgi:hypothetical protein
MKIDGFSLFAMKAFIEFVKRGKSIHDFIKITIANLCKIHNGQ